MSRIVSYLMSLLVWFGISSCLPGGVPQQQADAGMPDRPVVVLESPADVASMEEGVSLSNPEKTKITEDGRYSDRDRVALYIHTYGRLPGNYIRKRDAEALGWVSSRGNLHDVAPGMSIGGDNFGNYEGQLPKAKGRRYYECDIDYAGGRRNSRRIVYSSDGLVFYTADHYKTFVQLY